MKNKKSYCRLNLRLALLLSITFFVAASCKHKALPNQGMIDLLKTSEKNYNSPNNIFYPEATIKFCDSVLANSSNKEALMLALNKKANALLQLGQ